GRVPPTRSTPRATPAGHGGAGRARRRFLRPVRAMSSSAGLTSGPPSEPGPVPVAAPASDRPRRLLVVSATIGEGHNATAAAVEERARALWPSCEIRRVDTLELMGRATGPAFRWIYRTNVDRTPWLYDFFYRELWRRPWFASASSRFTGAWAGRA